MRSATLPPIRVEPEVRAEVEAVLREGESLTQFIEVAVAAVPSLKTGRPKSEAAAPATAPVKKR